MAASRSVVPRAAARRRSTAARQRYLQFADHPWGASPATTAISTSPPPMVSSAQTVGSNPVTEGSVAAYGSPRRTRRPQYRQRSDDHQRHRIPAGNVHRLDESDFAGSLGMTATTGGITVGTATSGGTQTLQAVGDIAFNSTDDDRHSRRSGQRFHDSTSGSVLGGSISANGDVIMNTGVSITLNNLQRQYAVAERAAGSDDHQSQRRERARSCRQHHQRVRKSDTVDAVDSADHEHHWLPWRCCHLCQRRDRSGAIIVQHLSVGNMIFVALTPYIDDHRRLRCGQMFLTTSNPADPGRQP